MFSHRFAIGGSEEVAGQVRALSIGLSGQVLVGGTFADGVQLEDGQPLYPDGELPGGIFMLSYDGKTGERQWAKAIPAASEVSLGGLVTDKANGDISMVGSFGYSLKFEGAPLVSVDSSDIDGFIARFDSAGGLLSADAIGGVGLQAITSAAYAPDGDLLLAGHFDGSLALPGGSVTVASGPGAQDVFVAKTSKAKPVKWMAGYGDDAKQSLSAVRVTSSGEVLLAGDFGGSVAFDPTEPLVSNGSLDGYLARLSSAGVHQNSTQLGDLHRMTNQALAVAPDGSIATAGHFLGIIDLGGGAVSSQPFEDSIFARPFSEDGFVARFSSAGDLSYAAYATGPERIQTHAVALDSTGRCAAAFVFTGTLSIGVKSYTAPSGEAGVLLVLFDDQGTPLFGKLVASSAPSPFGEAQLGVALTADTVLVAGAFDGSLSPSPGMSEVSAGGSDAFVVALRTADGQPKWSKRFGDADNQAFHAVTVDPQGRVVLAGRLAGTITVDDDQHLSAGGDDALLMQLDLESGATRWVATFGDDTNQQLDSLSVSSSGDILVAGSFEGAFAVGPDSVSASSAAGQDKLLALRQVRWARSLTADLADPPRAAISSDGATVLVAGSFQERVSVAGVNVVERGQAGFSSACFLLRFAADGSFATGMTIGKRGNTRATGLALDGLGKVLLSATFDQLAAVPLDQDLSTQVAAVGLLDSFVAWFTPP